MMRRAIGCVWVSPAAVVVWLFYLLPFWALGYLRFVRRFQGEPVVLFEARFRDAWYSRFWNRLWEGWGGHCVPLAVVSKHIDNDHHLAHELGHHRQHLALGPFFVVVYLVLLAFYGYGAHPLEIDAEAYANRVTGLVTSATVRR